MLIFNIAKLQRKQTVVTDHISVSFVNKICIIGKDMLKETWIAKIKEIRCWTDRKTDHILSFLPVSAWSKKKLPNFAVKHVDLS